MTFVTHMESTPQREHGRKLQDPKTKILTFRPSHGVGFVRILSVARAARCEIVCGSNSATIPAAIRPLNDSPF